MIKYTVYLPLCSGVSLPGLLPGFIIPVMGAGPGHIRIWQMWGDVTFSLFEGFIHRLRLFGVPPPQHDVLGCRKSEIKTNTFSLHAGSIGFLH